MDQRPGGAIRRSGRRSGQRFDAEHGVATEALLFLGELDPEAIGPSIEHATHYEPTPVGEVKALLARVPFDLRGTTFVDLGSGLGRAVLEAASLPFRQVVGVEISPALHAVACDNLVAFGTAGRVCRDVRFVRCDAKRYRFPPGTLVVYLFNPFGAAMLAHVLERLATGERAELAIVYHTPVERDVIEAHPAFELVADERCGAVYRRSGRRATATSAGEFQGWKRENENKLPSRPLEELLEMDT